MSSLAELASSALGLLRGASFGVVLLPLLGWSALSFGFAVLLGRAIRRADERAGILDEVEFVGARSLQVLELEPAREPDGAQRREPTRSGPFLIDRGVQANLRAHVVKAKRKA